MFNFYKVIVYSILVSILCACSTVKQAGRDVGEATGETVKTIKQLPHEIKQGYKEGRTN